MRIHTLQNLISSLLEPTRVFIAILLAVTLWLLPAVIQPPINNTEKIRQPLQEAGGITLVSAIQANAPNCARECQYDECVNWKPGPSPICPRPGPGGGCCLAYETRCDPGCEDPTPPTLPPTISAVLNCSQYGNNGWCIGDLILNLTASDPQGQSVTISGAVNGASFPCTAGATTCSTSVLSEGARTITYRVDSATGLFAAGSTNYKFDSSLPSIGGNLNGVTGINGWYRSNVTLDVLASDLGSGVASVTASIDGGAVSAVSGPITFTDGVHSIEITVTDYAGFVNQASQIIQVDTITPTLSTSVSGTSGLNGWYVSNVTITPSAGDAGSGLLALEVNADGGGYIPYTSPIVFTDGIHTYQFRVLDTAGNITETAQQIIQVDTVTPSLSTSISGTSGSNGWYVSNVTITPSVSDSGSGLSAFVVSTDGSTYSTYINPVFFTEGVHTYRFRATDYAGNITEISQQTIRVDTTTPTISLTITGTLGTNGWYMSNVTVATQVSDATSTVGLVEASADGGAWSVASQLSLSDGLHTYQFRVTDQAGNSTTVPLQNIKIDTIAPLIDMTATLSLGETVYYEFQDNGSGLSFYRTVIEDDDERYQKVTWLDTLSGNKFKEDVLWDGKFADGTKAGWGEYFITLKVTDAAGNKAIKAAVVTVNPFSFLQDIPAFTPPQSAVVPVTGPDTESTPSTTTLAGGFGGGNNNTNAGATVTTNEGGQSNPPSDGTTTTSTTGNTPNPFADGAVLAGVGKLNSSVNTTPSASLPWGLLAAASATVLAGSMAFQNTYSQQEDKKEEKKKGAPAVISFSNNPTANMIPAALLQNAREVPPGEGDRIVTREKDKKDDGPGNPSDIFDAIKNMIEGVVELKDEIPVVATAVRRISTSYSQIPPSLSQLEAFNQILVPYISYNPSLPKPPSGVATDVLISSFQDAFGKSPTYQELEGYEAWRAYKRGNISIEQYNELGSSLAIQDVNRPVQASQIDILNLGDISYKPLENGIGSVGGFATLVGLVAQYTGYDTAGKNLTTMGTSLSGWADLSQGTRGISTILNGATWARGAQEFAESISPLSRGLGAIGGALQFGVSWYRLNTEQDLQTMSNERWGVGLQMLGGGLLAVGSLALLLGVSAVTAPILGTILLAAAPIGLVIGAVGLAVENWDAITEIPQVWKNNFKQGGEIVGKLTTIAKNQFANNVENAGNKAAEKITQVGENLANKVTKVAENTSKVVTKVTQAVTTTVTKVTEKAASVVNNTTTALVNFVKPFSPGTSAVVQKVGQAVSSTITNVGQSVANKVASTGQNIANNINKVGQAASNVIKSTTQKAASAVKSITSSFSKWFKKP
ncbi:MAG: Ig-like domain repeat protein [Anaerolineales bacterium]|nr:Ig-like domain repeat protein [Anaerolineales bacterium]